MKYTWTMAAIGAALILSACGKSGDSHSSTTTTYEVNGMKPEDYFRQFVYRETGQCGTIHEGHHFPKSETIKIGVNREGSDVLAEISILLQADGTYSAFYQEIVVLRYFDSGYYWKSHQERIVSGRWSVVGEKLVLSNLGEATALQYNGAPAMQLRISGDLLSPGLSGKVFLVRRVEASYNPIPALDPCVSK